MTGVQTCALPISIGLHGDAPLSELVATLKLQILGFVYKALQISDPAQPLPWLAHASALIRLQFAAVRVDQITKIARMVVG